MEEGEGAGGGREKGETRGWVPDRCRLRTKARNRRLRPLPLPRGVRHQPGSAAVQATATLLTHYLVPASDPVVPFLLQRPCVYAPLPCLPPPPRLAARRAVSRFQFRLQSYRFFAARIPYEERLLVSFFGDQYLSYRAATPTWIPGIS